MGEIFPPAAVSWDKGLSRDEKHGNGNQFLYQTHPEQRPSGDPKIYKGLSWLLRERGRAGVTLAAPHPHTQPSPIAPQAGNPREEGNPGKALGQWG